MYHLHYQLAKDLQMERLREAEQARLVSALVRRRRSSPPRPAGHVTEADAVARRTATACATPAAAADAPFDCC